MRKFMDTAVRESMRSSPEFYGLASYLVRGLDFLFSSKVTRDIN